jgi:hypothetical protein
MQVKLKNRELLPLLNMINGFSNDFTSCKGLRNESLTMGVKLRLSKIEKELVKHYKEFEEAKVAKIKEVYPDGLTQEVEKTLVEERDETYLKLITDINECGDESTEVEFEPVDLSKLVDLESEYDYTFLIEKISE